ncbi:MAG TPA: primosomal protein N' [Gemmataceae bacterium]|nr:primosomal protein N' [Gemmataceae bacterium]
MAKSPRQPNLFKDEPAPAAPKLGLFAEIVFDRPLDQAFTYGVPDELRGKLAVGKRVLAPFGRGDRATHGFCVKITDQAPERAVKLLHQVLDDEALLTPSLLHLTRWIANYYLCAWGQVLHAVVPAGVRQQAGMRPETFVTAKPPEELPQPMPALTAKQKQVWEVLQKAAGPLTLPELGAKAGCGLVPIEGILAKGLAKRHLRRIDLFAEENRPAPLPFGRFQLNPDQLTAWAPVERAVRQGGFQVFLLHGVTGSGKTEIYLQAIEEVIRQGKEALVLVPEISLTPQTIERFRGRFGEVAVLHSHLTNVERGGYWRRVANGQVQVVVGARSAIFAPTRQLGLIVIDEEHENSFKQETTPRYHARDVAVMRACFENIPIILGSATPSLESWHNAERGMYTLLRLPNRVLDMPMPPVQLIDLRHEPPPHGRFRAISHRLERAMHEALRDGGQVILLLNRRGYSTIVQCPSCGRVEMCKHCDLALTFHQARNILLCHFCGYEQDPPQRCSACGKDTIRYQGQGTEKLQEEIEEKFPDYTVRRVDSDSMRQRGSHELVLSAFREGLIHILLGTQMIAKGLDFPNVTLVGVVQADVALHMPDFRSAERTFQLLSQVAGRAGRGPRGGKVLVQTFSPEQPCIRLAADHDYERFTQEELKHRRALSYPPYERMVRIIVRSRDPAAAEASAQRLAVLFNAAMQGLTRNPAPAAIVRLLGPAPAPVFKLQGYSRYHFQLHSASAASLHEVLREVLSAAHLPAGVEHTVDVDPQSML